MKLRLAHKFNLALGCCHINSSMAAALLDCTNSIKTLGKQPTLTLHKLPQPLLSGSSEDKCSRAKTNGGSLPGAVNHPWINHHSPYKHHGNPPADCKQPGSWTYARAVIGRLEMPTHSGSVDFPDSPVHSFQRPIFVGFSVEPQFNVSPAAPAQSNWV